MKTKVEIANIRKRAAGIATVNLLLGIGAMLYSLGEDSVGWTFFVWVAGLEGIAIGLLAGVGYAQVQLATIPPEWRMKPLAGFFWAILTFWLPIFATFMFGMMLYATLPDAARPKSSLEGGNGVGMMQSFVTFWNAGGCAWLMVMLVARKAERLASESSSEPAE